MYLCEHMNILYYLYYLLEQNQYVNTNISICYDINLCRQSFFRYFEQLFSLIHNI